jgi:hypothetical protein
MHFPQTSEQIPAFLLKLAILQIIFPKIIRLGFFPINGEKQLGMDDKLKGCQL